MQRGSLHGIIFKQSRSNQSCGAEGVTNCSGAADGDQGGQQGTAAGDREAEYKSQGAGHQPEVTRVLP